MVQTAATKPATPVDCRPRPPVGPRRRSKRARQRRTFVSGSAPCAAAYTLCGHTGRSYAHRYSSVGVGEDALLPVFTFVQLKADADKCGMITSVIYRAQASSKYRVRVIGDCTSSGTSVEMVVRRDELIPLFGSASNRPSVGPPTLSLGLQNTSVLHQNSPIVPSHGRLLSVVAAVAGSLEDP
jgi:hypothetical protein